MHEFGAKMNLNKNQTRLYRETMKNAKYHLDNFDHDMEEEIAKARERLIQLQQSKVLLKQIYENSAIILGVDAELKEDDADIQVSKTTLLKDIQ